ncbi:MAG: AhpC/TSA family protein [Dysgonamonadaceae bacterium]|jgi:thiol-disulfide isomerase/thioredoxin|nr:AhpC/TSA family protein [Dysgonamonadaceae bacterium]
MKRFIFLVSLILICFSCEQKGKYGIIGVVTSSDMEGKQVYLVKYNDAGVEKCDSTRIKDSWFSFEGIQEIPELYYIRVENGNTMKKRAILLEPGAIVVTILDNIIVNGTPANDAYQQYLEEQASIDDRLDVVSTKIEAEQDTETFTEEREAELNKEYDAIYKEKRESYAGYFSENINNPLGAEEFGVYGRRLEPEQLAVVLSKGNEAFKTGKIGIFYQERLDAVQKTAVGQQFVDIISKDPSGNAISLSDYAGKGKYLLVDFWASWCGPCRKEMPVMVELYQKYKYKKFEIVGYSLDRNAAAWTKGIEDLNMVWPQMSDVNFWQSEPVKNYAVPHIPYTILLDPSGTVIARGLVGNELKNKLEEVLK